MTTTSETPALDFGADPLDAVAVRVLGALVEKAFTTPDQYPLSLNALTAACNQTSNRDPVMRLEEGVVAQGIRDLEARSLAREVHRSDSRVKRWRHLLQDTLRLHDAEQAVLCVLLLRGPQTTGEIRSRTGRMFEFIDLAHVEITLRALMDFATPLAAQLPRQPGRKEARYVHLLAGAPLVPDPSPPIPPTTEARAESPALRPLAAPPADSRIEALEQEVATLRAELTELRSALDAFRREFQ